MASNNGAAVIPAEPAPTHVAGTNDIRPIKPPVEIFDPWRAAAWSGAILVLIAAAVLLWLWLRKRQQLREDEPVPPHVRARDRLNAALGLVHEPRPFCIAVSDAIRLYLEERFQLRAPERTTEEFLSDLQHTSDLSEAQKQWLAEFLERCDLVKFARLEPNEAALRELHESALRLVHETQFSGSDLQSSAPAAVRPPGPPPLPPMNEG